MLTPQKAQDLLAQLTSKQTEVLVLLSHHQTTKEIARELGLSPNTVDQRIMAVRDKWGTSNRKETARLFEEATSICGESTHITLGVDSSVTGADTGEIIVDAQAMFVLPKPRRFRPYRDWLDISNRDGAGLGWGDDRFGKPGRGVLVFVIAVLISLMLLSSLAVADALQRLFTPG